MGNCVGQNFFVDVFDVWGVVGIVDGGGDEKFMVLGFGGLGFRVLGGILYGLFFCVWCVF